MPINQEGVEVNEDGTPITDEQKETSDWTQVIELNNKTSVKPYSVDVMVTNKVPHNIPFLDVGALVVAQRAHQPFRQRRLDGWLFIFKQ